MSAPPKRRLGAGAQALLEPRPGPVDDAGDSELRELPLERVLPSPYQPRTRFDEAAIRVLAASLQDRGAIQPILVRRVGRQYELVAGERRLRAARLAGLASLPALVRDLSDEEAATTTLIENIQRQDLNPIDEAEALRGLAERLGQTHEQVADRVGRARATVTNLIRLLKLCPEVKRRVQDGELSMGHARVLVSLPAERQKELAQAVLDEDLSVRETERRAKTKKGPGGTKPRPDPDLLRLQQRLSDQLGCQVTLRPIGRGGGSMMLRYSSADSFQGLLERLGYSED